MFGLRRLFQPDAPSASLAKNRLQLVLAKERIGLSEEKVNQLKIELCEVISKYFEIDVKSLEINIMNEDGHSALSVSTPVSPTR